MQEPIVIYESEEVPMNRCTQCGKTLDACSGLGRSRPHAGDMSVCGYCGQVAIFDDELDLHPLTGEPLAVFLKKLESEDPDTHKVLTETAMFFKNGGMNAINGRDPEPPRNP